MFFPEAHTPIITGNSGSVHGASTVKIPHKNETISSQKDIVVEKMINIQVLNPEHLFYMSKTLAFLIFRGWSPLSSRSGGEWL